MKKKLPKKQSDIKLDPEKLDLVRQTMITILWKKEEIIYEKLVALISAEIGKRFNDDLEVYVKHVQKNLQQKKLLEESPGKVPIHYRLAQKLEASEE